MTTNEGVLRRWSRRKQAAKAASPASPLEHEAALAAEPDPPPPDLPPPDLPPVESLGVASDYTAFLQKGVTAEVQRRALQRAWRSDERIAGFRGMAEYAWDFNAPEYGRLWAADDVLKLVQEVLALPPNEPPPNEPPGTDELVLATGPSSMDATMPSQADPAPHEVTGAPDGLVATVEQVVADALVRRHGSALPS